MFSWRGRKSDWSARVWWGGSSNHTYTYIQDVYIYQTYIYGCCIYAVYIYIYAAYIYVHIYTFKYVCVCICDMWRMKWQCWWGTFGATCWWVCCSLTGGQGGDVLRICGCQATACCWPCAANLTESRLKPLSSEPHTEPVICRGTVWTGAPCAQFNVSISSRQALQTFDYRHNWHDGSKSGKINPARDTTSFSAFHDESTRAQLCRQPNIALNHAILNRNIHSGRTSHNENRCFTSVFIGALRVDKNFRVLCALIPLLTSFIVVLLKCQKSFSFTILGFCCHPSSCIDLTHLQVMWSGFTYVY